MFFKKYSRRNDFFSTGNKISPPLSVAYIRLQLLIRVASVTLQKKFKYLPVQDYVGGPETRARTFKCLWGPGIDFKE
jgi:hypothetical protein